MLFQRESRGPAANRVVQTYQTPQGLNILHVVDAGWIADRHRQQRQDSKTNAVQRGHVKSGGPRD